MNLGKQAAAQLRAWLPARQQAVDGDETVENPAAKRRQLVEAIRKGDGVQAERIARARVIDSRDAAIRALEGQAERPAGSQKTPRSRGTNAG